MTEFQKGDWAISNGEYVQIEMPVYRRDFMLCRKAGSNKQKCTNIKRLKCINIKRLIPASLTPDFSNAKVGDECFSPILSHCQIVDIDGNWEFYGDTKRFDVSEIYVKQKHTNNYMYYYPPRRGHHPSLYNSFAQFQAYWAEQEQEEE